jgi:hypothetical protein
VYTSDAGPALDELYSPYESAAVVCSFTAIACQPATVAGFTQASIVTAFVGDSDAVPGMVTMLLDPLNRRPDPYRPVVHEADAIVPSLLFPEESCRTVPAPSANAYAATGPLVAALAL